MGRAYAKILWWEEAWQVRGPRKDPCGSIRGNEREQSTRGKGWKGYCVLWPDANVAGVETEQESTLELEVGH